MTRTPIFLSVVIVVLNRADRLDSLLSVIGDMIAPMVSDYELIVVDNASTDDSVARLKSLTQREGLPNLQAYVLTKEVDQDTASWVGFEGALGDFVVVLDPDQDEIDYLPTMINAAVSGADVVFASSVRPPARSLFYGFAFRLFNFLYGRLHDIDLSREAPRFRLLAKRVINFILQQPQPSRAYRYLPATAGFTKVNLTYQAKRTMRGPVNFREGFDKAMLLLTSTSRAPLRAMNLLCLAGALLNMVYSTYVIAVALLQSNVAAGWVTLSLQQSGMFLLLSLVLMILSEYVIQIVSLNSEGPRYHVAQEFTSAVMTRREKLNIETAGGTGH